MIDELDKRILFELNWDCRQTNSELSKKLKVSKQVIGYRIAQLEKDNIIKSYHAMIDWRKLGYNSIRVYLKWKNIPPLKEDEIYEILKKDSFFMWTVKFEGDFDIAFYLWTESIPEFSIKWFKFLSKYRKYIMKYELYESVNMIHYPMKCLIKNFLIEEKIIGNGNKVSYDQLDFKILKMLTLNGRISVVDIANEVKLTPKAVIYRIKQLKNKGILLGFNALIDTNKLNLGFYKVDFYLNSFNNLEKMFDFSKLNRNIIYRMRTIGGPDFEIEVLIENPDKLKELIDLIRKNFEEIEYYRIHRFEYVIKQVYLPGDK